MAGLLAMQLLLLWLSLGPLDQASAFCTGSSSRALAGIFGGIHLAFAGLAILGLVSLRTAWLRPPYALLLVIGVSALPVQARLVSQGQLLCDGL